jgi:hypothetical protein
MILPGASSERGLCHMYISPFVSILMPSGQTCGWLGNRASRRRNTRRFARLWSLDIELDDAAVLGLDQTKDLAVVRHDEAIGVVRVARFLGHAAVLADVVRGRVDERTPLPDPVK